MSSINFDSKYHYVDAPPSTTVAAPVGAGQVQSVLDVDKLDSGLPATGAGGVTPSALAANPADIDGVAATASDEYAVWQEQLAILANENVPNTNAMLALAEVRGVPVQTAVQDIVDALGISAVAENQGFVGDRIAELLVNSTSLQREQIVGQLATLSFIANRSDVVFGPAPVDRELVVQRNYVQAMQHATWGSAYDPHGVEALRTQYQVDMAQARALNALEDTVRNNARSYGTLSAAEVTGIVDQCVRTFGHAEQQAFVSAAEIQSIVAGVSRRPIGERTEALALIAQEMLARQAAGTLAIDPVFQEAVQSAAGA